jgi:hypothetical protein
MHPGTWISYEARDEIDVGALDIERLISAIERSVDDDFELGEQWDGEREAVDGDPEQCDPMLGRAINRFAQEPGSRVFRGTLMTTRLAMASPVSVLPPAGSRTECASRRASASPCAHSMGVCG